MTLFPQLQSDVFGGTLPAHEHFALPPITTDRIEACFKALSGIGNLGPERENGFTRAAWSAEESRAMEFFARMGNGMGLSCRYDAVGNLYIRTPWRREQVVQSGSHLDTIPCGGNYDGAAGVVCGMIVLQSFAQAKVPLDRDLELVVWRGEESGTYGAVYGGSRAAFGLNDPKILENKFRGKTLEQAMLEVGADPSYIRDKRPTLSQEDVDKIFAHLELHIEQGKVLETGKIQVGIVNSIRGPSRYEVLLNAPDDRVIAEMVVAMDRYAETAVKRGIDLVETVGVINTAHAPIDSKLNNCAITAVAGYAEVRIKTQAPQEDLREALRKTQALANVSLDITSTGDGYFVKIIGDFDHAGATPMGREFRRNANLAASVLITELVGSISGTFEINYPDLSGNGRFLLDIRGRYLVEREQAQQEMLAMIREIADKYNARITINSLGSSAPIESLHGGIQSRCLDIAQRLQISAKQMPSGAGHDVAVVSKVKYSNGNYVPTGLIFVPCRNGVSHNPLEYASIEQIHPGALVLQRAMFELANADKLL